MSTSLDTSLSPLARRYGIDLLYVFGSRTEEIAAAVLDPPAAGHATRGPLAVPEAGSPEEVSDVDIGVQPERDRRLSARDRVRLTVELERELGVTQVDLVILPEADPFLAAEIVRGELLYARDLDEEANTQLYHLRRAGDLAPFFREQWRDIVGSEL